MATEVFIKDNRPTGFGHPLTLKCDRELEKHMDKYCGFARYPNGNGGYERRLNGRNVRDVAQEFADANGYKLDWIGGDAYNTSKCILRPV